MRADAVDAGTTGAMDTNTPNPDKLVDAEGLRLALFDPAPSKRWIEYQTARKTIPYIKIGRLVRFDVAAVRAALGATCTIKARNGGAA
jgi:hypothetical protein